MSLLATSAQDTVLALINANNPDLPVPVTAGNLYFGNPSLASDGLTTVAPAVGNLSEQYEGYATFQYQRINLSVAYDTRPVLKTPGAPSLYRMLPLVNQFLGQNFTEDDILDVNVSAVIGGAQINIPVVASPGSLGYVGQFNIQFFRLRQELDAIITSVTLPVMLYPGETPTADKVCLDMLLWNYDFSSDHATLAISGGGTWVNPTAVAERMLDFDLTAWPTATAGTVKDYPTSAYPGANTAFQRVTVQSTVTGTGYEGNALFHYNLS